jgi:hypothetical protein
MTAVPSIARTTIKKALSEGKGMTRPVISDLLEQAEKRLAASDQQVMRQRRIVEKLRAIGADTWGAQALLNDFQDIRRLHARDRDRLRGLLKKDRP